MKLLLNLFTAAVFLFPACIFAADYSPQKTSTQQALPDNLMEWMSRRYDSKTMLGFKWENPDKAKIHYAFAKNNSGQHSGFLGKSAESRGSGARLDIMPLASFYDANALDTTTNSYLEIKYTKPGAGASWNIGYLKYSETRNDWIYDLSSAGNTLDITDSDEYRTTKANVLFGSLVFTLPIKNLSYYAYGGPAFVKYEYTVTGTYSTDHYVWVPYAHTSSAGVLNTKKSATTTTWIAGVGGALRLSDSGFGIFAEYKHMPETGSFAGIDNLGAGVSFGF